MFGSAESEHPRLTNGEIIWVEYNSNLSDHNPPTLQTAGRTHRAVKTKTVELFLNEPSLKL